MKNRTWPFVAVTVIFWLIIAALLYSQPDNPMTIIYIGFPILYVLGSLAVFTCFILEPVVRPVPLYKKIAAACVPFMLGNDKFLYWIMKEISPSTTYEQFLAQVDK